MKNHKLICTFVGYWKELFSELMKYSKSSDISVELWSLQVCLCFRYKHLYLYEKLLGEWYWVCKHCHMFMAQKNQYPAFSNLSQFCRHMVTISRFSLFSSMNKTKKGHKHKLLQIRTTLYDFALLFSPLVAVLERMVFYAQWVRVAWVSFNDDLV